MQSICATAVYWMLAHSSRRHVSLDSPGVRFSQMTFTHLPRSILVASSWTSGAECLAGKGESEATCFRAVSAYGALCIC